MRDDLIGFVLGALDASEEDQIRRRVEHDAELRDQMDMVKRSLRPLSWARGEVDPPADLVGRTCQRVKLANTEPGVDATSNRLTGAGGGQLFRSSVLEERGASDAAWTVSRAADLVPPPRRWDMSDVVVAAGVCVAAACLFFPAIANSRWRSQVAGCQNNMRDVGTALIDYSGGPGGYFPQIPASGKLSVAGIYAPKLVDKGLLRDGKVFLCPGKGSTMVVKIPRIHDIINARGPQLVTLHRTMGGDYAYPLGFVHQGRLRGIRNEGRTHAALLADAPLDNSGKVAIGTHGRGQNVLFEDGHVKYMLTRHSPANSQDDLFFNDHGLVRAGLHSSDFVLAPSPVSPLGSSESAADGDRP